MSLRDARNTRASYAVGWNRTNAEVFLTLKRANRFAGRLRARGAYNVWMWAL